MQRLDNVNRTHLVLASGKLVLQNMVTSLVKSIELNFFPHTVKIKNLFLPWASKPRFTLFNLSNLSKVPKIWKNYGKSWALMPGPLRFS